MGATFKAIDSRWPGLDPEMNLKPQNKVMQMPHLMADYSPVLWSYSVYACVNIVLITQSIDKY